MLRRRRRQRRGLALMIVLSLLVLFLLMGVSYLMVARQSDKSARAMGKAERRGDDPRKLHETVIYQLLRDTNIRSSLLGQSLLADLYGNDGATGTLADIEPIAGPTFQETSGQFMRLQCDASGISRPWLPVGSTSVPVYPNYFNGRVITMVTGRAKGISSRVVDSRVVQEIVNGNPVPRYQFRIETFEADGGPVLPGVGDRFIVNGAPFNGAGAGFHANRNNVDNTHPDQTAGPLKSGGPLEIALSPHYTALNSNLVLARTLANFGGADESYDAVDYQNMYLAMVPASSSSSSEIIPSFHRPSLINYWYDQWQQAKAPPSPGFRPGLQGKSEADFAAIVARNFSLRPLPIHHPNFTGSNPQFLNFFSPRFDSNQQAHLDLLRAWLTQNEAPIANGGMGEPILWDVDNDNDGVPDSIWMDVGLPVTTSPDGRRVKPLVAILVKDLDGRLNLNAHSNLVQAAGNYTNIGTSLLETATAAFAGGAAATTAGVTVPRGRGYGPAEIYFAHILDPSQRATELDQLLSARYGPDGGTPRPGYPGINDPLSRVKALRHPAAYEQVPPAQPLTHYASPPDIWGFDAVALNFTGQAFWIGRGLPDPTTDEPYELNLSDEASEDPGVIDASYKLVELERLLRYTDLDSAVLASRLSTTPPGSFDGFNRTAHQRRNTVTTESRHIPVAKMQLATEQRPPNLNYSQNGSNHLSPNISDLLQAKLEDGGFNVGNVGALNAQVDLQLPFEVKHGELFNLNRLFGNGFDDNNNFVVDDPNETGPTYIQNPPNSANTMPFEFIWRNLGLPPDFDNAQFNYLNNQVRIPANRHAKQMYARHLYCLMMLLIDSGKDSSGNVPPSSYLTFAFTENSLTDDGNKELMAQRVAQWAINVVDFRDADAIMTPFEYDVDPLNDNGWDLRIDGDPRTNEFGGAPPVPDRRIVWGCEYPDLVFTEVTALHDRRVMDTDVEDRANPKKRTDSNMPDDDVDQYRLPQGSLYMEFYCPRNRFERTASEVYRKTPQELYTSNGTIPSLDLGRMSPARPTGDSHPVWRVGITEAHPNPSGTDTLSRSTTYPDSVSFQPEAMSLLPPPPAGPRDPMFGPDQLNLERFVWFANVNPTAAGIPAGDQPRIYWNRLPSPLLRAGGYAVVGPRVTTNVGSRVQPPPDLKTGVYPQYLPSEQRLVLDNSTAEGFRYFKLGNATNNPDSPDMTRAHKALPILAAANFPTIDFNGNAWNAGDRKTADLGIGFGNMNLVGVGVNVSEPLSNNYYPQPTKTIFDLAADPNAPKDSWFDPGQAHLFDPADPTNNNALPDEPFDVHAGVPLAQLANEELNRTATRENYRTAFLQRLADPTIPWNPGPGETGHNVNLPVNPYLTVDWSPIDLTVFSGEMRNAQLPMGGQWVDDFDRNPLGAPDEKFDTREKGFEKHDITDPTDVPPDDEINIWTQQITTPQNTNVNGAGATYFHVDLINSLGFLNHAFGLGRNGPTVDYRGDPLKPWPWLIWSSRPFDSPLELMNVPATSLSRLLHEFDMPDVAGQYAPPNQHPYDARPAEHEHFRAPFEHLLNFFHSSDQQYRSPHFYRIFDVVQTPSPFVGTEKWYNPIAFGNMQRGPDNQWGRAGQDDDGDGIVDNPTEACWPGSDDIGIPANSFRPPYNYLSRFRDPGRVNINTIFDPFFDPSKVSSVDPTQTTNETVDPLRDQPNQFGPAHLLVWEGITKGFPSMDPRVNQQARILWNRVYESRQGYAGTGMDPAFPTRFAQPFRSASTGDIAPLPNLRQPGVDVTLLRRWPPPITPNAVGWPLFDFNSSTQTSDEYNSSLRNPGFRYAGLQRLSNLLTTHSNVFAVWVTIGYFEVEPPIPALSPDPQLGPEIGSDTGAIRRHRAFYIIDRSIPVAYEPGENHNVDNCIQVKRFIE